ncbi:hypothetical protein J8F10_16455 [Gemmata sp. G18]|uniref:Uncharacterized protein n=1 Tax=Gemmata palustris TaxID=2822762 RepID=A0ABS5BT18_9BACT|nr:hypothetical protein [Gemmata palustris]MBP3956864.1 hypothetical protein [Gemmata palustris]
MQLHVVGGIELTECRKNFLGSLCFLVLPLASPLPDCLHPFFARPYSLLVSGKPVSKTLGQLD